VKVVSERRLSTGIPNLLKVEVDMMLSMKLLWALNIWNLSGSARD